MEKKSIENHRKENLEALDAQIKCAKIPNEVFKLKRKKRAYEAMIALPSLVDSISKDININKRLNIAVVSRKSMTARHNALIKAYKIAIQEIEDNENILDKKLDLLKNYLEDFKKLLLY